MRAFPIVSVACGLVIAAMAAPDAAAEQPARAGAARARPAWSSVPVGNIPKPPDHAAAPERIAKDEAVAGVRLLREQGFPAHRVRARVETDANARCLAQDVDLSLERDPVARRATSTAELRLGAVTALRSERLVIGAGGAATLEVSDIWVDPRSLGARIGSQTQVPLSVLARGPANTVIYGYRNDAGELSMVIPTASGVASGRSNASGRGSDGTTAFAECGHIRVSIGDAEGGSAVALIPMDLGAGPGADTPHPGPRAPGSRAAGALSVKASVAKLSRDPAPLISVLLSWSETAQPTPSMTR